LKDKESYNLIALYMFYTYNAQYQKNNQPYAIENSALIKWIIYCEKNSIKRWIEKLNGKLIVEQFQDSEEIIKLFDRYEYV